MIKRLILENFKSIKKLDIELAPLTIFIGPNGSGKSSILEAIALMAQAFQHNLIEERTGLMVDIEDVDALFLKGDMGQWLGLGFEIELEENDSLRIREKILEDIKRFKEETLFFLLKLKEKKIKKIKYLYRVKLKPSKAYQHLYDINGVSLKFLIEDTKIKASPKYISTLSHTSEFFPYFFSGDVLYFSQELMRIIEKKIKKVYYISTERGNIPWYKSAKDVSTYVGKRGEYVLEFLSMLMKPENDEKRLPYELISKEFGIEDIWSGWERENVLTSNYRDPWLKSTHKLSSLGYGSRQLLPIIAQIANSERGSIILIDEPEISLHPAYQIKLPILFGNAVQEGKQILVTTHSSYFPLSIHRLFDGIELEGQTTRGRKKIKIKLNVKDVAIYHVERNKKGYTTASRLEIDENGLKEAIPSFADVEIKLLSRFIKRE